MAIGLDFGTTNSSIAVADRSGVTLASFPYSEGTTEAFRSLLYLNQLVEKGRTTIQSWSGPAAIDRYLQADEKGRLIQSLKSFLANASLQSTEVFGRRFQLEELITRMLRDIRKGAESLVGSNMTKVVVGRPVRFVGSETDAGDAFALTRLETSLHNAGFENVSFEYEPVAAAYHYESTLDHDEQILIGDFGGGTSDFSLLRVGPSMRAGRVQREVLGNEGVAIAGDSFDAKIVRHLVSPALGAGTLLRSGKKLLPVPTWVYFKLERWHHLSFLRSKETMDMLVSVARQALETEKIQALLYLVTHDLGYHLHRAVQRAKLALSQDLKTDFHFSDGDVTIAATVTRADFESWIDEELREIAARVDILLHKTGVPAQDVDAVFLTGGSSFVPAVRQIFEHRFGASKIRTGDEFTSVARGLALKAFEG